MMHTSLLPKAFLLSAALAAVSLPARAGTSAWFDAGIAGYAAWPSDGSDTNVVGQGTWSGTSNASLDAGALAVDAGAGAWLAFEAGQTVDVAASNAVYAASVTISSIAEIADIPAPAAEAKTGLTVAKSGESNAWFAWARDPAGATNVWLALEGAAPATGSSTGIRISLKTEDGALWAQYEAGGTALTADGTNWLRVATEDSTLHGAKLGGSGYSVSALSATTVAEDLPPPPPAVLTLGALPENVTLVSVTTNGVAVAAVDGAYTVYSNATVAVAFAPAEGYRLVGDATVVVAMDGDTELATADMPTAELIPPPPPPATATLTIPSPLPDNVTLVSVTTNGVDVAGVEGVYTVLSNATVVATFAAAEGSVLVGDATVTVVVDGDKTLTGIPTAVAIANGIKINEIMASNPSLDKGGIASEKGIAEMDWIEIYNGTSEAVDLTGWYLSDSDKKGKEDKATILGSCVIPAGGYKIVWLDKTHTNAAEYAATEAFAVLKLSSSGDLIQLADPNKTVIDKINFKDKPQIKGYSYGPLSVVYNGNPVPGDGDPVYMKTATPGAANVTEGWGDFTPAVTFSEPHGYKTEAFDLTLSCEADPTAAIYYTLDGTSPTTASTPYTGAIHVDRTTVVRAAVPDPTSVLQFDTSATYIFLDDVLAQAQSGTAPASAVGFPNDNAVNNQEMLYGMRQSVVTGADRDRLLRGFTNSIATLSVVVDPANLFNSTTGIYVNPRGDGVEWERQIMLEGFDPTGVGADFAQPAGIRLRGGYSRRESKPKHSFRFFFRSSYGVSSLAAKMFVGEPLSMNGEGKMKEEAGEYDKLDLRTSQNNSWANDDNTAHDTFVTEVFSRDSQRDLGQPYTRSRYYNLFINGQYWGLYQTQERGDEHWAESYLGGDSLQYDLIKTGTSYKGTSITYSIECNEGTWDAWSNLWRIATQEGFGEGHYDNYNKVLGLDANGDRDPALPILLNPESLMVYMLVSHYVVDRDGPTSPFSSLDKGHANNFYAIRNRDDAGRLKGFVFLRHDAEMSMGHGANTTASNNPTFWGTEECTEFTGAAKHRTIPYFTPAELHYLLMKNPTYKRAYADLFYRECLREGGAMTVENATERYVGRMNEITDAIVCEAARWGKGKTRSTWVAACATSTAFITNRLTNMKSQYQAVGWYPTNTPPFVVSETGVRYFDGDEVPYLAKVCLTNNEASGTIYYTTNGVDDPMDAGVAYTGGFDIPDEGFTVRARLFKDGEWSAMEEVALEADVPNDQRYGIRVAAILNAAVNDPADEFIVLTNTLDRAVSLEGLSIWSEKAGQTLVKLAELGAGVELAAGGTVKLSQPDNWIGDTKLKNGEIYVELRDFNGKRIQNARVDSGTWFPTGEFNDKGKEIHACDKTGRWFVALEFLGDTDGGEVTLESQWAPSPEISPIEAVAAVLTIADGNVTTNGVYESLAEAVAAAPEGATVVLLADDSASFTVQNLEIGIGKALTIDGNGHTLHGIDDYAGGSGDHDIYVSGSGDVTIRNITLADFGGAVPVTMRTYPIWTGSAYAGTLTLDNVTVESFNRTAFNLNGGTVVVKDCTIAGDMAKGFPGGVFQEGIGVYNANVTVENTTITGAGSTIEREGSQIAACIQLGNPNGPAPGTGSITVRSGTFSGEYGIIVASNALNDVTVQGGAFTGALLAEEGEGGSIAVSGGTFDAPVPAEFAADGYAPTTIADNDGRYTVRTARTVSFTVDGASYTNLVVADGEPVAQPPNPAKADHVFKGWTLDGSAYDFAAPVTADIELAASFTDLGAAVWIGGASGAWDDASKWDIGCVPTRATVVTFTNDAEVAILADQDHCKKMVLDAGVTIVPAGAGETHLIFWGDDGVATSGAGTLTTDGVTLFKAAGSGTLAMNAPLAFASSVALTGNHSGSSILALNGPVTLGDGVTVTSSYIDYVEVRGGLTVPAGATATLSLRNYEMTTYRLYSAMTLVHPADEEGPATTLRLPHSFVIFNSGAGVVTDSDDWYVKAETSTPYDTYTVLRKAPAAFTVLWVVDNETVRTDTDVPAGTTTNWVGELPSKATDERYSYAFGSWTTNGVDVAPAEVAIVADTTFAARFALSPLPMDPGQNLTAADLAGENRPIATTNAMFTVKFRTKTPLATYRLVASPTLVGVDWTAATAVGEPATSDAEIPDGGQLMTLAAPMGEDAPPVRFFKIRASLEEP